MSREIPFIKMHGLGNDFVVLDARTRPLVLNAAAAKAIAERRTGVGCDQVVLLEPSRDGLADVYMRIFNADGGEVATCGNAARCVASLVMAETGRDNSVIETMAGLLDAEIASGGKIAVDMGRARLDWRDIPLAEACDTRHLPVVQGVLSDGCAVSMGNPHIVFFVPDVAAVPLETLGPKIEHHKIFPERANVEIVQVLSREHLRVRVWERGAGITRACGTGACAALVAAHLRGLSGRHAEIQLDGGVLDIEWLNDDHVMMTGPVATSYRGVLPEALEGELHA